MKWININRKTCFYLVSALILLIGLSSALFIYWTAEKDVTDDLGYKIAGGAIYPSTGDSKKYMHDMRLYGGEAAVMADKINRWFAGLWQGTSLAYTVACIAIFMSLGFFLAARHAPSPIESDACKQENHDS
jgi:hypothetical protein